MSKSNDLRRNEITKIILAKEKVRVEELATTLNVTAETIRSDLTFLEAKGILYRTHGGATLRNSIIDIPMDVRIRERAAEKKALAYKAINFIEDDDTIFIDPSSTALPLGILLRIKKNLTIVTNSYELVPILAESDHRILFVGGEYSRAGKRTEGGYALDMIESICYDLCITGMVGCLGTHGPATGNADASIINKRVMKRSKKKMILTDASKFKTSAPHQYARFDEFDILVTNTLSEEDRKRINIPTIVEVPVE